MIYSKTTGSGFPVVLIHGYGENHHLWDELTDSLKENFKIIAIDLPGFGKSQPLPGNFNIDDIAATVQGHLTSAIEEKSYIVLGHSLGGYVTLSLAEQFPEYIRGFGLINSTALADSPDKRDSRIKTAEFIKKHGASIFLKSFVPNLFFEKNMPMNDKRINLVIEMGKNLSKEVLARYMLAMRLRPDRRHLLEAFNNVLFIGGKNDAGLSDDDFKIQADLLKRQENAHYFLNTGHMSMYEAPDQLFSAISHFLKAAL